MHIVRFQCEYETHEAHTEHGSIALRKRHAVLCLKTGLNSLCTCTFTEAHSVNCINLTHYYHQRELHLLACSFASLSLSQSHIFPHSIAYPNSNRRIRIHCHVLLILMRRRNHLFMYTTAFKNMNE